MKIPPFSLPSSLPKSLPTSFDDLTSKIPDNMKTMSVERRHILTVTHAVPQARLSEQRVLDLLPPLPASLAFDTLKIDGESCALLQTVLFLNDNFRYSPLPIPSLDFWQLDFRVLVRNSESGAASAAQSSTRKGAFVYQSLMGTRVAWALGRAVAGKAEYADFNVIVRGAPGHEYAALIADVLLNGEATTQFSIRATDEKPFSAPFVNWTKQTDFLLNRARQWSRFSVGEKTASLEIEQNMAPPLGAEFMPVGGEIKEARFALWEKSGLLNASEMRRPFSILLQPHTPVVLSSPTLA